MARRRPTPPTPAATPAPAEATPRPKRRTAEIRPAAVAPAVPPAAPEQTPDAPRILIASRSRVERERLAARLLNGGGVFMAEFCGCGTAEAVREALGRGEYDLILLRDGLAASGENDLLSEITRRHPLASVIVMADEPSLDEAVDIMRRGAADLVTASTDTGELLGRIRAVLDRARRARSLAARHERLRRLCRRLNTVRREVTRQVGSLCSDLAEAYQDLADQMASVAVAGEFGGLVRQELEVEGLLRTALEYILAKTGPTNAAVFLPSSSSDYSLGAYVNYDCPKDTADVLLDHLAGVVAPRMQDRHEIVRLSGEKQLRELLGDDADWLGDATAVSFACFHEGECLAVVILFRDRRQPFGDELLPMMGVIAELFGRQLARVIRIHHRHLPKDKWGGFDAEGGPDDLDMAA